VQNTQPAWSATVTIYCRQTTASSSRRGVSTKAKSRRRPCLHGRGTWAAVLSPCLLRAR